MKILIKSLQLLSLALLLGCTPVIYRTPGAETFPLAQMAVLEDQTESGKGVVIEQVDMKWRGLGLINRYELTPGEHSITVAIGYPYTAAKIHLWFEARAGETYIVEFVVDKVYRRWNGFIYEKGSRKLVSYNKSKTQS